MIDASHGPGEADAMWNCYMYVCADVFAVKVGPTSCSGKLTAVMGLHERNKLCNLRLRKLVTFHSESDCH